MADLHVDFLGKRLAGPVIAASGTFGFGPEYADIEDLRLLGGISGKGLTLNGQPGNEGERLYETPSGLMNSIGLQNPGVQHFIDHELPAMRQCGTTVWANLGGHTIEENIEGVAMLCAAGVDFIELNTTCPIISTSTTRMALSPLLNTDGDTSTQEITFRVEEIRTVQGGETGLRQEQTDNAVLREVDVRRKKRVLIGRGDDCDIKLVSDRVSRHHCEVLYKDGHYELRDLGSTNGTYVDGARVTGTVLRSGAVINVPTQVFAFSGAP